MTPAVLRRQLIPERQRLIVALDEVNPVRSIELIAALRDLGVTIFKVSAENFMWPDADDLFRYLIFTKSQIMFDLKFWDTPDTVARLVKRVVGRYAPLFITVHPSREIVGAALVAAAKAGAFPGTIAPVAYLSSDPDPDTIIPGYNAVGWSMAGVVPAHGVEEYASVFPEARLISPGIRLGDADDNHVKTVPPGRALKMGASYIVVGRPIVQAPSPAAAAERYLQDMNP